MNREIALQEKMHNLQSGQIRPMEEILEYCKRQNRNPEDFWLHIPRPVIEKLDGAQKAIIEGKSVEKAIIDDEESLKSPTYQLKIANAILSPRFKLALHQHQFFPLKIVDQNRQIVSPIFEGDGEKMLTRALSMALKEVGGIVISAKLAMNMVDLWINHQETIPMPVPMANHNENVWCFHKTHFVPDASVTTKHWQNILDRMSDPLAFAAWVYGVYIGDYRGRQVLWLHGPNGEDGKSAIANLIAVKLFGPAHNAISNASLSSNEKRFLTSFFENARLVIYPDASNKKCLLTEQFKTVASAGADPVLIERKGRQAYTSKLNARMWVCSNFAPEVTDDNYVRSRLLYIHIDKMEDEKPDPKVLDHLEAEIPGFLHYAKQAYETRCRAHYEILTDQSHNIAVDRMTESFFEKYEVIFQKYWEIGSQEEFVEGYKVYDTTQKEGLRSTHDYKDFTSWLIERKGVVKRKISQDKGKVRYYGMQKRKPAAVGAISVPQNW